MLLSVILIETDPILIHIDVKSNKRTEERKRIPEEQNREIGSYSHRTR